MVNPVTKGVCDANVGQAYIQPFPFPNRVRLARALFDIRLHWIRPHFETVVLHKGQGAAADTALEFTAAGTLEIPNLRCRTGNFLVSLPGCRR